MGMNLNNRLLVEKGIFSKEEFLEIVRAVDQEMKRKIRGQVLKFDVGGLKRTKGQIFILKTLYIPNDFRVRCSLLI